MTQILPQFPPGPIGQFLLAFLITAIVAAVISRDREDLWPIALAMGFNCIFALYSTQYGHPWIAAIGNILTGLFMVWWGRAIGGAIASLYVFRLFSIAAAEAGIITQTTMWIISAEILLTIQIVILLGGAMNGRFQYRLFDPRRRWQPIASHNLAFWRHGH